MTVFTLRFEETLALIGIDRAEARNAVPLAGWRELAVICETISNRAPDAVLLRSEAADIFSAGADIGEFPSLRDEPAQRVAFREAMAAGIGALAALPMPVIAAVDGGCFGAGVALMLGCDICVAGREARFATTPARLGLSYPGSDVARLIDRVGKGFASLMLFTGEAIDADRAVAAGLADLLAEDAGAAALALARTIARNDGGAVAALKAVLRDPLAPGHASAFDARFGSAGFERRMTEFLERKRG